MKGRGDGPGAWRGRQGRRWLHLINHCISVSCKGTQGTPRDGLWPADWWWLTRGTGLRQSDPSVLALHSSDAGYLVPVGTPSSSWPTTSGHRVELEGLSNKVSFKPIPIRIRECCLRYQSCKSKVSLPTGYYFSKITITFVRQLHARFEANIWPKTKLNDQPWFKLRWFSIRIIGHVGLGNPTSTHQIKNLMVRLCFTIDDGMSVITGGISNTWVFCWVSSITLIRVVIQILRTKFWLKYWLQ